MKKNTLILFIVLFSSICARLSFAVEVPAFPGAQGFGAKSVGGRGGVVMEVTNLNDSGTGSLRACVQATGPRICVFRIGGTITLLSDLSIANPYLTIAGQTAPGGGITLKSDLSNTHGLVTVRPTAHDVVIRYIRSRPGAPSTQTDVLDAFTINSNNVILDHVSASWAIDENVNFWYTTAHDITIQNSIISEGLNNSAHVQGPHSKGLLSGNENNLEVFVDRKDSILHNLFANNYGRNPETKQGQAEEVVNNLIYNWSRGTSSTGATLQGNWEGSSTNTANRVLINIIGNMYIAGPSWTNTKEVGCTNDHFAVGSKLYVHDNIGPNRTTNTLDDWTLVDSSCKNYVTDSRATTSIITSDVIPQSSSTVKDSVLADAGASKGLNADGTLFLRRDAVDKRIIEEVKNGGGKVIDCPSINSCYGGSSGKVYLTANDYTKYGITDPIDPAGWPILESGTAPIDTDHDGMPDIWETAHGLNPNLKDSSADRNNDGYTNVEEYMNGQTSVISQTPTQTITTTPSLSPSISPTSSCIFKKNGDADCKKDINGKDVALPDFEIWRKEFFAGCSQDNTSACGPDEDGDGSLMDANFNYPGSASTTTDTVVNLTDFEIWRKGFFATSQGVKAFPSAEGFGSSTIGGRSGKVIEVTNVNVDGAGSFKAAIQATGPRIIVFKVGGTIDSTMNGYTPQEMTITNPYITIAGQTAPGDGIMLKGITLRVNTHDVIIRGLRIRVGDAPGGLIGDGRDGVKIETNSSTGTAGIYNVIVDHNSVSWAVDENMSTWTGDVGGPFPPIHDVTFSWNIISEGLNCSIHADGCHSKGLLVGDHSKNISVHHNLFAHNSDRAPENKGDTTVEIINNTIYNYKESGFTGGTLIGDWEGNGTFVNYINVIGNYYIKGADWANYHGIGFTSRISPNSKIFVKGNLGPYRTSDTMDDWVEVQDSAQYGSLRSNTTAIPGSGITTQTAEQARQLVLQNAGATAPHKDSVDVRVINDVINGTGHLINHPSDIGGWPVISSGTSPTDTDHDGIPDSWEISHSLNPNTNDSAADRNGDGYTNIEEYINQFLP